MRNYDYKMMIKIHVKQYNNFTKEAVASWFKSDLKIQVYNDIESVEQNDYVIMTKQDPDTTIKQILHGRCLIAEDYYEKFGDMVRKEASANYDYWYLRAAFETGRSEKVNTIITGSSYGLYGVDRTILRNIPNLSMTSQDMFYMTQSIRKAATITNLKKVVMIVSHYIFFTDMSLSQNDYNLSLLSGIYGRLYEDVHHGVAVPKHSDFLFKSTIFDTEHIMLNAFKPEYEQGYFYGNRARRNWGGKTWSNPQIKFGDISEEERRYVSQIRALEHNKLINHKISYSENIEIFNSLMEFCKEQAIELFLVVPPASKYYTEYLLPELKKIFYETLENCICDYTIHLLDLFGCKEFLESDFKDSDHLDDLGARKFTETIISLLNE